MLGATIGPTVGQWRVTSLGTTPSSWFPLVGGAALS